MTNDNDSHDNDANWQDWKPDPDGGVLRQDSYRETRWLARYLDARLDAGVSPTTLAIAMLGLAGDLLQRVGGTDAALMTLEQTGRALLAIESRPPTTETTQ